MNAVKKQKALLVPMFVICIAALVQISVAQEVPSDYQQVLKIVGKQGDYKANVLKVNIPRNDLHMKIADYSVPTPFGFGGWFAMTKGDGDEDVLMGDLVELSSGQRSVLYLYGRAAVRQSGCGKPAAVLRKSLRHQIHILLATVRWI